MPDDLKPLCRCGDELPPGRKGEVLVCIHCGRKYRALGRGKVELATDSLVTEKVGDAEVFRFDDAKTPDDEDDRADRNGTVKMDLREKRRQAEKRRSAVTARASGQSTASEGSTRTSAIGKTRPRNSDIPGGVIPMVVSIIVFNALAFIALAVFFPTKDGVTATPWGSSFPKPKIPWLEMLALVLGHAMGFGAWAVYVHRLHVKQKAARAREREDEDEDSEDDEEEKFTRKRV